MRTNRENGVSCSSSYTCDGTLACAVVVVISYATIYTALKLKLKYLLRWWWFGKQWSVTILVQGHLLLFGVGHPSS